MKTFETYQEAKIANPDSEIYTDGRIFCGERWSKFYYDMRKCNPADYCMNEDDFYSCGYRYLNGDIIYSEISGLVIVIGMDVSIADMDWNDGFGHKRFILRAAALKTKHQQEMEELKPKRTRVEYVKVTESIFDLRPDFEAGELYFKWAGNGEHGSGGVGYDKITTESMLLCRYEEGRLLRRKEVEIDEESFVMDALIDSTQDAPYVEFHGSAITIDGGISIKQMRAITDALDDNGKFK